MFESTTEVTFQVTRVFYKLQEYSNFPIVLLRGGTRSSKTWSVMQKIVLDWLKYADIGIEILILKKTMPSIKESVFKTFRKVCRSLGKEVMDKIKAEGKEELRDMNFRFRNSCIHFMSLDDPEKIKCYTPEHDVLTDEGFKSVTEIKIGDKLATLNPITKQVTYEPVTKTYVYDYKGKVYKPKVTKKYSHLSFRVTPDHKLLGSKRIHGTNGYRKGTPEYIKAKDLKGRFSIPRSGKWTGKTGDYIELPINDFSNEISNGSMSYKTPMKWKDRKNGRKTTRFEINNFLSFLGWYISEGCLGNEQRSEISISQSKEKESAELEKVLKDFPYKYWKYKNNYSLSGKDLYNYLKPLGKAHEKYIPKGLLDLHPKHLQYLFDALMLGDGHKTKTGRWVYGTNSKQLVDDVCELSLKLGLVPTVRKVRTDYPSNYPNGRDFWQISICKQDETELQGLDTEDYDGKVYCFEVPPYHNVMIRHNGRTMWCGQSCEYNIIFMEEITDFTYDDFQQVCIRKCAPPVPGLRNQVIGCFNPIDENHWIKTEVIDKKRADVVEFHSSYLDNPFLDEDTIRTIEDLVNQNPNFARVYRDGEWGKLDNIIFSNYATIKEFPSEIAKIVFGVDWGFNAPMTLIKVGIKSDFKITRDVYIEELFYDTGYTTKKFVSKFPKLLKGYERKPIYCDAANPEKIKEVRDSGFKGKKGKKGKNSVKNGIDFMNTLNFLVTEDSSNTLKEFKSYSYKTDKKTGKRLDEPIDYMDHAISAIRYAVYTYLNKGGLKFRWL